MNMSGVLRGWESLSDSHKGSLVEEYRLEVFESKRGEFYILDNLTMSGFQVNLDGSVDVILSGVDYFQYYRKNDLKVTVEVDLKKLFRWLVKKEKINSDRLKNVLIFMEDVYSREKVRSLGAR